MADDTMVEVARHVGEVGAGGGLVAMVMQWLRNKEAREARDALIALQGKVDRLVTDVANLSTVSKEQTLTEGKAVSAHDRLDGLEDRIAALEQAAFGSPSDDARRKRPRR